MIEQPSVEASASRKWDRTGLDRAFIHNFVSMVQWP